MVLNPRQIVCGIGILILGVCCALPFQKTRNQPLVSGTNDVVESSDEFIWGQGDLTLQVPGQEQSSPAESLYEEGVGQDPSRQTIPPPRIRKHANLGDGTSDKTLPEHAKSLLRPDETLPFDSSIESGRPDSKQTSLPMKEGNGWQWYEVRRGDTLVGLASRFLGDAKQSSRIQQLNADQLTDLQSLPVGLRIRIPKSP